MADDIPKGPSGTAIEIMRRLVNTPPKPHHQMASKRKGQPKPEKRTAGKGLARVGRSGK